MITPTRVLIVDDSPADARLVQLTLDREPGGPFGCERVNRISAALTRLAQGGIDVVLLDMDLPDSTGVDGLSRIRAASRGLPIVALSGSEDPRRIRAALEAGAQDYRVKQVFSSGFLGRVIARSIAREKLRSTLLTTPEGGGEWWGRLDSLGEGAACVNAGRVRRANPSYDRIAGGIDPIALLPTSNTGELRAGSAADSGADGGSPALARQVACALGWRGAEPPRPAFEYAVWPLGAVADRKDLILVRVLDPEAQPPRFAGAPDAAGGPLSPSPAVGWEESADPIDTASWGQLEELAAGEPSFLKAIVASFIQEADAGFAILERAVAGNDLLSAAHAAHTLKSAAAQVGGKRLSRDLGWIERRAAAGSAAGLSDRMRIASSEFGGLKAALQTRVLHSTAPPR